MFLHHIAYAEVVQYTFFNAYKSLDTTIERGRWKCISTARLYINEGLNELQNMQLQNASHLESYHEYVRVLPDQF